MQHLIPEPAVMPWRSPLRGLSDCIEFKFYYYDKRSSSKINHSHPWEYSLLPPRISTRVRFPALISGRTSEREQPNYYETDVNDPRGIGTVMTGFMLQVENLTSTTTTNRLPIQHLIPARVRFPASLLWQNINREQSSILLKEGNQFLDDSIRSQQDRKDKDSLIFYSPKG